jgi:prepilin signal peptidase PulO-like enzyme (type II secretory pathway)
MIPFQTISLATALVGTTIAAIWDLKTTEVPDQVPYAMIGIAILIFGYQSIAAWSYMPIVNSLIVGLPFLAFGFLMYYLGQWGGADALILGAIGFLLPTYNIQTVFSFPIAFIFNLFLVGAVYMLIYSMVLAFMNRNIIAHFVKSMKASCKLIAFGSVGLFLIFYMANYSVSRFLLYESDYRIMVLNSIVPLVLTIFVFIIWKFAKAVEDIGFKKKIPISKLRVGDMLLKQRKLTGITAEQIKRIRKSGTRYVWIKEGVRFAPAFVLALLFTIFYGDVILLLFNWI